MGRAAAVLVAAAALSGCATVTPTCDWGQPIRPSVADVLTADTVRQILRHNATGEELCGWRA